MTNETFDQALDAVERLPDEEQADLLEVVRRRLAERGRRRVVEDIHQSRSEFNQGVAKAGSVDDLMREIES